MTTATMGRYETNVTVEPIPGNPGYIASITGHLADPETDPTGTGARRLDAALDLARTLLADARPGACLAIAAVLREEMAVCLAIPSADAQDRGAMSFAFERAIATVEGIA